MHLQMTHELSLLHAFNARPLRPSSSSTSSSLANQCRVVQLHDAFTDQELGSCVCLVLEYMAGGALDLPVKRKEPLNEAQLAHVAGSVCAALVDLRRRRLLHRDVKPSVRFIASTIWYFFDLKSFSDMNIDVKAGDSNESLLLLMSLL
jgi:serine/threonine protein kinase